MSTYSDTKFNLKSTKVGDINVPMKTFEGIDYKFMSFVLESMPEHLEYLKNDYKVRDDDIFICTYIRSGTNWTHEIVQMLMHGSADFAPLFAFVENLEGDALDKRESPRILCSHLYRRMLPPELGKKGKIICVHRNPKDVAVSVHHFMKSMGFVDYNAEWKESLQLFLDGNVPNGSWFDYMLDWEKVERENRDLNLLTLYFEDMKLNLRENVEKIANFLGVKCDSKLISDITEKCDSKIMIKEKTTNVPPLVQKLSRDCANFLYRKGDVGDWKNWFTVEQNEEFDKIYSERMKKSKYTFLYSTAEIKKLTI